MFDVGFPEFIVLAVIALFVIGPERLPGAAAQAGRVLRELRAMATGARRELSEHLDLDPELKSLDLQSLDPRQIVRRTLLEDDDDTGRAIDERNAASARANGSSRGRTVSNGERPPYDDDAT